LALHDNTFLLEVKDSTFRTLVYREPYGILKVKDALVKSAYCIMEYVICSFVIKIIELALGLNQPCYLLGIVDEL